MTLNRLTDEEIFNTLFLQDDLYMFKWWKESSDHLQTYHKLLDAQLAKCQPAPAKAYDVGMTDGAAEAARANARLKKAIEQAKQQERKAVGEWLEKRWNGDEDQYLLIEDIDTLKKGKLPK